jgi:hypothetical protein
MEALIVTSEDDLRKILKEIIRKEMTRSIAGQLCGKTTSEDVLLTRIEMAKFCIFRWLS